jgi:hypothetical protein
MSIVEKNRGSFSVKFFSFYLLIFFLSSSLIINGCGGGGGGSSSTPAEDIGPIVSIIEGYVYVPSSGAIAPQNAVSQTAEIYLEQNSNIGSLEVSGLKAPAAGAVKVSGASAPARAGIIPTSGYVPLVGATVQLSGTNKATVTNPTGYYKFEIGQKEIMAFGSKKLMINKTEANVSIEFEVAVVSGDSRYIHTEINTKTGEKTVKEVLTNRVLSPFIYVSGKAGGATGVALSGALVTAVKVSDTSFTRTATTDSFGRYSFSELTDGLYTLTVVKENYKITSKNVEVSGKYTLSNIDFIIPGTFSLTPRQVTPELSAVKIVYATSVPTAYSVEYGLSTTYLYNASSNLYNITNEIILSNLSPKTVYHYRIKAIDQYGNTINTDNATFETLDPNTNSKEAPIVNSNYTVRKTHNSITLTFNTNMSSYAQIEYAVSSAAVYTRYPSDGSEIGPQTNFELTVPNLTNSTTYKVFIVTKNIANRSVFRREPQQLPIQVTTDNSPDITPPVVSGVTVTDLKAKSVTINFSSIDIHEGVRNNTDAKVYYGLASYPVLQYDYSVIPPRVRLDYYQKISEALAFNFDSQKVIKLSGLEPSKTYYFRPASNDPSGNIGTVTTEVSFTTAAPGTALAFSLSESPAAGQISVGEHAKIFRLLAKGSTEENLIIKKMVFKQTGSIPYNAIDKLTVTDGVNTWTVNTPVSSNIEVKFDSPALSIPKNNSIYLTVNMTLNTSALNPGGAPRDVKLKLDANSAIETNVEVTGDIYGDYIKEKITGLSLESNAQAINIGQLVISPPEQAQNSNETLLVNRGQKDITLFKFKLESNYEDINITKIQLSQIGSAIAETDYSNIRLYDGISSIAVGASSGSDILFQSVTGLIKVVKGSTNTKTLSVVADIQLGATDARFLRMQIDKINISGSGSYSLQNVDVLGVGTPVTGAKFTIGDSELLANRTTDSPTKQTFKIGDTNKTFTIFELFAGSAEDVRIDTMELMFQGTASFTSSSFSVIDENNTVIYTKAVGGGGITAEANYKAATKKFTVIPQSSLIVPKGGSKKVYVKGNISSTAFEVGKTIQINVANDGDIKGTGVQTGSSKAAVGTAIGSEHSIIGGIVMAAVLPQPSNVLLPGSKYNDTPNNNTFLRFKITPSGEPVDVQSFSFVFSGSYTILDSLRVIEYKADTTTEEVAINPSISGNTITLTPQATVNLTTAGKTFYLVGDILNSAVSSDTIRFNIAVNGISVRGTNSAQIYKTQELINGNTLSVSTEAFYLLQSSVVLPETIVIGDTASKDVFSFKLEAKPRSGYYLQKITMRQLGTATFGIGQDISSGDFEFFTSGDGIVFTKVASAIINVSGTNLMVEFPSSSNVRIDATAQTTVSQFLTCKLVCKTLQTAINNKTLRFYMDDSLTVAKSITSNNQITGGSSAPVTGAAVTLKEGSLLAKARGDNPAAADISDALSKDFLIFDITSEVEALDVQAITVTLDVKNGLITDFDSTSMTIAVNDVAYPNSTVSSSGNKFVITPRDNTAERKYLRINANSSVKITISGKANYTAAQNGSQIALRIADNSDITAVGVTSTHKLYSTGIINGNYMTIAKSPSSLTVSADANPAAGVLTNPPVTAARFAFKLTAGTSENIKLTKMNISYDGFSNNFDANSIQIVFPAPITKTYTSANITFSNNIFTLSVPSADNIPITSAGVVVTVSGARSSGATSGQQFFLRIGADGDISGTGVNSAMPVFSTGTAEGNKFTIDAANTSILGALNAAFAGDNPAAATVASGQRLLIGKINLQTKKFVANNFVDSVRIKSIEFTKAGTITNADITKWELTDGSNTFTGVLNTATLALNFDNMNYIVPLPSADADSFVTQKTMSLYATVKDSVRNVTLSFALSATTKISADGALYGNNATVSLGATPLTSNAQTLDIGKLVMTNDAAVNGNPSGDAKGSASAGDVNVTMMGLNIVNNAGTGGAAASPEDVYITQIKITNSGTGVPGTDFDSLKLYEKSGAVETFIANAAMMTDTATSQKYFLFSDSQLNKVEKNIAAKNLIVKANVPATATNGKTIKLSLQASDITGKGYNSSVTIQAVAGDASIFGKNIVIGTNSLTVSLDSTTPPETNFSIDETEREVAVFAVKTGTGESITLDMSVNSFEYSGTIPKVDFATVRLRYNNTYYPLTNSAGNFYTTNTPIAIPNNTTALFSIFVKLKPEAPPLTLSANQYIEFKIGGVAPSILSGTSSITAATVNSVNGTPAPVSNKFIVVGKLAIQADSGSPSGSVTIGATGVNLFSFKLTPSTENATVSSVKVMLDKGSFTTDLNNLKLKKESYIDSVLPSAGATSIVVTGINFNTAAVIGDFTIGGANAAKVTALASITSTAATFTTNPLAGADAITIQAKTSAYSPASAAASNTLTFTIGTGVASDVTPWSGTISGNYITFSGLATTLSTATTFTVAGDIRTTSVSGTNLSMKIESVNDISATGFTSTKTITPTGSAAGNTLTTASGGLSVSLSAYHTNIKDVVIGGAEQPTPSGVLFAIAKLTASNTEDMNVTEIKFNIEGSVIVDDDFGNISPYGFWLAEATAANTWDAGAHLAGLTFSKTGNIITVTGNPITTVTKNTSKHLVIGGTAKKPDANSGRQAKIVVESGWIKAAGVTSAKALTSTGGVNYNSGDTLTLAAGILNSAINSSSPSSKTILKGLAAVELARFDLKTVKSSNSIDIENIEITRIEVYLSSDTSNFTNTKIKIDGGADINRDAASTANTHIFLPPAGTYILDKNGTAKVVTVFSDAAAGAAGKVYAKLVASGTQGKGALSTKTISCTSSDQTAAEHTIGTAQMLMSSNSSISPTSQYIDVTNTPLGDKLVLGGTLNVDNNENISLTVGSQLQVKLEGSVDKTAVTALKINAGAPGFATVWINSGVTPFNNASQTYSGGLTGAGLPIVLTKNTGTQFQISVTLDQALVKDGDTMKITLLNGGLTGTGATSSQTISSQNELSNTLTLQKTSIAFSANTYATGVYKRGDTGKTIIDFNVAAGKFQNVAVSKIILKNDAVSGVKTSFNLNTEIDNFKVYIDNALYSGTVTPTNVPDVNTFLLTLGTPVTITKGASKQFKVTVDFKNTAVNGSYIKAKTDNSYYVVGDFNPNMAAASNITGAASGNEHNVQVIETLNLTLDSTSPASNNITITPMTHGATAGVFGHIATFKLKCSGENATLTKAKFKYAGSSISDISNFEAYLGANAGLYAEGTKFSAVTIDTTNKKVTFEHTAGIVLTAGTDYYFKIAVKVPNGSTLPVIGHSIRMQMDSSNSSDPDYPPLVLTLPVKGTAAGQVSDITYNANAISNSIYIDSTEIFVKAESDNISGVNLQFPSSAAVSNHKIMELTLANTSFANYTIDKFVFEIKQEGTQTSFDSLTSSMSLSVFEGSEKIADAAVVYNSSKLSGTFTITNFNSAYKTILKGQSKTLDIKFSSGKFMGTTSPKILFAVNSLTGTHSDGSTSIKGTQYTRIPIDAAKSFAWSSSSSTVVEVTNSATLVTAAAGVNSAIIRLKANITLAAGLDISGGVKTIDMNNFSITTAAGPFNINTYTNTTFKNGTVNVITGTSLTNNGAKTLTIGENCTINNVGTINNISGGAGIIVNNSIINNASGGVITNSDASFGGTITNLGSLNLLTGSTFTNGAAVVGSLVNAGTLQTNIAAGGNVIADGDSTFSGSGSITTLTINRSVNSINILCSGGTGTLSFSNGSVNTLYINNNVGAITTGGVSSVNTLTYGDTGVAVGWPVGMTINNIDQSSVATARTINLGTVTAAVTSVKGHATSLLTLTSSATLVSCTINSGTVNITGLAATTFNVAATASTTVTATGKTLASVSGATTININGANAATVSGAVTTLNVTAAVTTLNVSAVVTTLNIGAAVTNSSIVTGTNAVVNAGGNLAKGAGSGMALGVANTITVATGGIINTLITGRTATTSGVPVAGITPTTSGSDCTVSGTAAPNGATVSAGAGTVTVTAL